MLLRSDSLQKKDILCPFWCRGQCWARTSSKYMDGESRNMSNESVSENDVRLTERVRNLSDAERMHFDALIDLFLKLSTANRAGLVRAVLFFILPANLFISKKRSLLANVRANATNECTRGDAIGSISILTLAECVE